MRSPGARARMLFGIALAAQLVLLYWPRAVQPAGAVPWDKLVHAAVFGLVYLTGVRAGLPWRAWLVVSLVHAPVSEVLQDTFLPHRSGDPYDALADALGVLLAFAVTRLPPKRGSRTAEPADRVREPE